MTDSVSSTGYNSVGPPTDPQAQRTSTLSIKQYECNQIFISLIIRGVRSSSKNLHF